MDKQTKKTIPPLIIALFIIIVAASIASTSLRTSSRATSLDQTAPLPCDIFDKVPRTTIFQALFYPEKIKGWGQTCNPNTPYSPFNQYRRRLGLLDPGKPYHPLFNPLIFKCSCP